MYMPIHTQSYVGRATYSLMYVYGSLSIVKCVRVSIQPLKAQILESENLGSIPRTIFISRIISVKFNFSYPQFLHLYNMNNDIQRLCRKTHKALNIAPVTYIEAPSK